VELGAGGVFRFGRQLLVEIGAAVDMIRGQTAVVGTVQRLRSSSLKQQVRFGVSASTPAAPRIRRSRK